MTNKKIITRENQAVIINWQTDDDGVPTFWANLYVNARNGIENADITLTCWEGKTLKGAEKFADKVLGK